MSYKLFLDDVREPYTVFEYTDNPTYCDFWAVVRNYDQFVKYVEENGVPDVISFDHDLADEHYWSPQTKGNIPYNGFYADDTFVEKTGYHCARWFINWCMDRDIIFDTEILIHSMNPVGSENIKSLFTTYNKIYKS